ncbi:hypothetical protein WR25_19458 [Diploscapter pachys]|uniref:Uncharacterized protein n=1 Tax=Diploscapter pachys TaxID=2018661 RepID=A0A2A2KKW4_9BILA|nr:hypothetical protein WR25_19458 [Diploscapter pachys]
MLDLFQLAFLVLFGWFVYWVAQPYPDRLLGVYSRPGRWYWLKFRLMRFIIDYRQKKSRGTYLDKKQEDLMNSQWGGTGGNRPFHELDRKHEFPEEKERAVDAVFVNGSNSAGWYLTFGAAQRPNNIINLYFTLRIPGVGVFVDDDVEKNSNVKSVASKDAWKTESGFTLQCIKPMREWKATFKGKLRKASGFRIFTEIGEEKPTNDQTLIDAEFDLTWTNFGEYFDFDTECSPTIIGHSLAIEPWSLELFRKLKASHQSHYEQAGHLNGRIRLGDQVWNDVSLIGMRDHTIGSYRNWSEIRRYVMMFYRLDDGTVIHTSVISMPEVVFSQLEFGYVVNS